MNRAAIMRERAMLTDLDTPDEIARFIDAFYAKVLKDQQLAPIFIDVAGIDLDVHLGHIRQYWEKLLLGATDYRRHTMNIHRALHAQRALTAADFTRWLALFEETLDERYQGPRAERARQVARHIAANMQRALVEEGAAPGRGFTGD